MRCSATIVEHVARAICEQAFHERHKHSATQRIIDRDWPHFVQQAQAALEAAHGDESAIAARRAARESWDGLLFAP